ncbi:unnamed protein product [Calypogeia fissa]
MVQGSPGYMGRAGQVEHHQSTVEIPNTLKWGVTPGWLELGTDRSDSRSGSAIWKPEDRPATGSVLPFSAQDSAPSCTPARSATISEARATYCAGGPASPLRSLIRDTRHDSPPSP